MFYRKNEELNISTDGTSTITVNPNTNESRDLRKGTQDPFLDKHNIVIDRGGFTAGTITITAKSIGAEDFETVYQSGAALTVDISSQAETIKLTDYPVESFKFVGSSMTGGSGNDWNVTIISGY